MSTPSSFANRASSVLLFEIRRLYEFNRCDLYRSRSGKIRPLTAAVVVFLILTTAGLIYWINRPPSISTEQAVKWVQLADEANACLENEIFRDGFELAERRYIELKEELPDQILPYRNHVILRILKFKSDDDLKNDDQFVDDTFGLVEELLEKDSESFQAPILAVRWRNLVYRELDEVDIGLLEQACDRAGKNPIPFVEFYELTAGVGEQSVPGIEEKRRRMLAEAYARQKENLKLAFAYLQQLSEERNFETFSKVWDDFQESLGGIVLAIDQEEGTNKREEHIRLVDEAIEDSDWDSIQINVRFLSNLVRPRELFKIDASRVSPHPLELMVTTLDESILEKARDEPSAFKPDPVQFEVAGSIASDQSTDRPVAVRSIDFDLDGELEVAVLFEKTLQIFEQQPDSQTWKSTLRFSLDQSYDGLLVADLDFDFPPPINPKTSHADPDLILFGRAGILVLENQLVGDQRRLVPADGGDLAQASDVTAAVLVDIDHDMDLDLVTGTEQGMRLFLSRGNLSFFDFSEASLFPKSDSSVTSLDIADFDRDIDIDVVVGFENRAPGLLENLGHAKLRFREFDPSLSDLKRCKSLRVVELDGQPSWDLLGATGSNLVATTTRSLKGSVKQKESQEWVAGGSKVCVADFNNDGYSDVLAYGDAETTPGLLMGSGSVNGALAEPGFLPDGAEPILDCDYDDFDRDGKVDLVAICGDQVRILKNITATDNQWVEVTLCGISSSFDKGRVNNFAVGSFIEVSAGNYYFATVSQKPRLHLGVGENREIDIVRVLWPSGMPQSLFKIETGQVVYEEMFEKGSCPYIYTWDGSKYTFFSDCLWAAPLGLQSAPGEFIPCREWEYLKIPGEILQPIDGEYRIQLTEELREAAYFDLVELIAVDHPEDVEIYTNEKVGPPFIAEHRIHTVTNPRLPLSARDKDGNDVLAKIRDRDQVYFQGFRQRKAKGLAPMHYLELDLGDLPHTEELTLFLHGWIRPTDCSLNISFSQNPELDNPVPPVIKVPDGNGNWVTTVDPMGFPGGKPKTIAVDLSKAFRSTDHRLRIETSHEIYWDQVFFTQGEPETEFQETSLSLKSADLHYRGFSRRFVTGPTSPEWYDYDQVTTTPRWPAMSGNFTRYGEVSELLLDADDCSVVIGSGDEMTLTFEAPPSPPAGWKRDFVIHLVGYDKDGDLNTVTGQQSGPLPFAKMSRYPYSGEEKFPDSEKHRRYLETYQTRTQDRGGYWKKVTATD